MKLLNKIVVSKTKPETTQVLWIESQESSEKSSRIKVFIGGKWKEIGADVDLSDYVTKEALEAYYTAEQVDTELSKKIDTPTSTGTAGQILELNASGKPVWANPVPGSIVDTQMSDDSPNPVQNSTIKNYVDNKLQDYAKTDGYYESMGVGTAVNLAGQLERSNDSAYRTSGGTEDIASGTARVQNVRGNTVSWNQLYDTEVPTAVSGHKYYLRENVGGTIVKSISTTIYYTEGSTERNCFDLTLIFGEGNEPTSVEQFEADYEKWFGKPLTYEPYNAGELIPAKTTALKTTGFNQWDEEWEVGYINSNTGENQSASDAIRSKNYIDAFPSTTYYIKTNYTLSLNRPAISFYDANKVFINGYVVGRNSAEFTTPAKAAYIRFAIGTIAPTYNHDICVNLSWSGTRNGTYEPYEEHTLQLPITTLTGKLNGEGESVVVFPNGMHKFDRIYMSGGKTYGEVGGETRAYQSGDATSNTMITDGYAYTYVQLATSLIYELDNFTLPARYRVNDWGTEEQLHAEGVNSAPAILSLLYGVNAVDALRRMPRSYISEQSMDNFLAQLGAAMNGTWSKTFNETTEEWEFSFVANTEPEPANTDNVESTNTEG